MRRLIASLAAAAAVLLSAGCRRHETIHPEPTEEGSATLLSVVNMADPRATMQLVRGFHQVEQNAWRWTMGRFAVTLRPPEGAARSGARLVVGYSVPASAIQKLGPMQLTARYLQQPVGQLTAGAGGQYTMDVLVPAAFLQRETVTFDFTLDKFLAAGTLDGRELGIIVSTIALEVPGKP